MSLDLPLQLERNIGQIAVPKKKWVPLLNENTSVEKELWNMVCQGINTISMTSDTPTPALPSPNSRRRDAAVSDREKEEQWYQGGKDKKTALTAMKTDPLYQLNSDESQFVEI